MSASDDFNALPLEVRKICGRILSKHQLRDLQIERNRAVAAHKSHLRKIDAHIKSIEGEIKRLEDEANE